MRRAFAALLVGIAATLLAACGGGGSGGNSTNNGGGSTASPTSAVKTYLSAIADGDANRACSVLSPAMQSQALREARSQGVPVKNSTCPGLFSEVLAAAHFTAAQRSRLIDAKVTSVTVHGNKATVALKGASQAVGLTKAGGKWLITGGTFGVG